MIKGLYENAAVVERGRLGRYMRATRILFASAVGALFAIAATAQTAALTVSPGESDRPTVVEGRCPTFSWSAVSGAENYQLVVYEFAVDGPLDSEAPVLSRSLPGGALSWTPGRGDCLALGKNYAWFVRAVGRDLSGEWSQERLFRTKSDLTREGAADALAVLQRYLSNGGSLKELTVSEPVADTAGRAAEAREEIEAVRFSSEIPDSVPDGAVTNNPFSDSRAPDPGVAIPLRDLGVSATASTSNTTPQGGDAVAVRGEYDSSSSADVVVGYLGVAVSDTDSGEFDGFLAMKELDADEIGVLGFSANSSADNYGVVGLGVGNSDGARFLNTDSSGNILTEVSLGTMNQAVQAKGDVVIDGGLIVTGCTSLNYRVGAWCIGQEETARNYANAWKNCWSKGKQLCPLEALLACDHIEPAGADCTATTDDSSSGNWIWCAEGYQSTNDDINILDNTGTAQVFAATVGATTNQVDWHGMSSSHISYCCTAR